VPLLAYALFGPSRVLVLGPDSALVPLIHAVVLPFSATAQRERKKVEALFAELKNQIGLRRLRLRSMKFVREQFLAAAAQNIKQLVRFLSQPANPAELVAA
jgi:MFS superfamily sulfate permease-like transporter